MAYLSFFISVLALSIAVYFYRRFRRQQELSADQLSSRISSLLSEFNSVSATNVDLLDDRIDELRRVIELADLKAKKLERIVDNAEGVNKSLRQVQSASNKTGAADGTRREKVLELARQGYEPAAIAEKTGIRRGEISVILRLNRSRVAG
ncbi:MAG: hypothetical protein ACLFN5_01655 [bacterium]